MNEREEEIKNRLTWDNNIDESQIEVIVMEDTATLKGCVSTYPEKVLAEIETQLVTGINMVINDIEVKFPGTHEALSDNDVREAMYCLLDANSEITSNDIKVSIEKGIVVLEGKVNSYWKSEKTRNMASHISGVVSVKNKIQVIPDEETSDDEITELIINSMKNSVSIDVNRITIKVKNGVVTLSGTLNSMSEYNRVKGIVELTKGVIDIKDKLKWVLRYQLT